MGEKFGVSTKKSINEILENAVFENEKQTAKKYTPAKAPEIHEGEPADKKAESAKSAKPFDVTGELISRYSDRPEKKDEKSDTKSLRDSLNAFIKKDKDLLDFYNGKRVRKSEKVDELFKLIGSAELQTESDLKVMPEPVNPDRFKESSPLENREDFKHRQQKLFELTDTLELEVEDLKERAEFDEDYEALSAKLNEKLEKGELELSDESTAPGQLAITDDGVINPGEKIKPEAESEEELKNIFGLLCEDGADVPEITRSQRRREKKAQKAQDEEKREASAYEYNSKSQNEEISAMLQKAKRQSRIRLVGVLIFALVSLYFALAKPGSAFHGEFFRPGRYGVVYILADLQILLFGAFIVFDSIKKGAAGLFGGKPTSDSVLFVLFAVTGIYSAVSAAYPGCYNTYVPFSLVPQTAAICSCIADILRCNKDFHAFKVISGERPKYVAAELSGGTEEADEFYKYLLDDSGIYTVKRTGFVNGFFRRIRRRGQNEDLYKLLIPFALLAGVALATVTAIRSGSGYESFMSFVKLCVISLSFTSFFMITLPASAADRAGRKCSSALIGDSVAEEYSDASVISFADTEVYPSGLVKITSIKTYGDYRIDLAINDAAKAFSVIGGPLSKVLNNMLSEPPTNFSARVIESAADGVCVVTDGNEIFLGKRSYMHRCRFKTPLDVGDEEYENTVGSVMFMAINDVTVAKIYVRYTVNPRFDDLLRSLYRAGMCVGIKTLDPNISNELLSRGLTFTKCPIAILKAGDYAVTEVKEAVDSGIVSNASMHTFLKMFIVCDKVRHVTKSNGIINILSVVLSVFVSFFLCLTGAGGAITPVGAVILQFLWLIPVWLTSRMIG